MRLSNRSINSWDLLGLFGSWIDKFYDNPAEGDLPVPDWQVPVNDKPIILAPVYADPNSVSDDPNDPPPDPNTDLNQWAVQNLFDNHNGLANAQGNSDDPGVPQRPPLQPQPKDGTQPPAAPNQPQPPAPAQQTKPADPKQQPAQPQPNQSPATPQPDNQTHRDPHIGSVISMSFGSAFTLGLNLPQTQLGYAHGESNLGISVNWRTILSSPLDSVVFSFQSLALTTRNGGGVTATLGLGFSGGLNNELPTTIAQNYLSGSPNLGQWETVNHSELDLGFVDGGSFDYSNGSFSYGRGVFDNLGFSAGGFVNQPAESATWSISMRDIMDAVIPGL